MGTRTIRQTEVRGKKLQEHIAHLGYEVFDWGELELPRPVENSLEHPKYFTEMLDSAEKIIPAVKEILESGQLPVILGGDHSIALPTFSGIQSYFRGKGEEVGLIWFDAHADMNTPETSPSGNLHGMPLAHLLGYGFPQLVELEGFSPKLKPKYLVHIGARDLDNGEKKLIRELGRYIAGRCMK